MAEDTYTPTDHIDTTEIAGERVRFRWWQATANLSPLPDAPPPRFPRRLDWQDREDGGWLALGASSLYGPCGCCLVSPCLPQCPLQTKPPRTPTFWTQRWQRTAAAMSARGEEVNPLYRTETTHGV